MACPAVISESLSRLSVSGDWALLFALSTQVSPFISSGSRVGQAGRHNLSVCWLAGPNNRKEEAHSGVWGLLITRAVCVLRMSIKVTWWREAFVLVSLQGGIDPGYRKQC